MIYTLRHFGTPLMRFSAENGAEISMRLLGLDENHRELRPPDFHRLDVEIKEEP